MSPGGPRPSPRRGRAGFHAPRGRGRSGSGKGHAATTSAPHIVSTGGSPGRARAVPLTAPCAARGRHFPSNTAARVGSPWSETSSPPAVRPGREVGVFRGACAERRGLREPPLCVWRALAAPGVPAAVSRLLQAICPAHAGCTPKLEGDTAAHSGHSWTGLPGRKAAGHCWTWGPADAPPGTRNAARRTMAAAPSSAVPDPVDWRVGQGGACARGWAQGAGPGEQSTGAGRARPCSAPEQRGGQGAPPGGLSRIGRYRERPEEELPAAARGPASKGKARTWGG